MTRADIPLIFFTLNAGLVLGLAAVMMVLEPANWVAWTLAGLILPSILFTGLALSGKLSSVGAVTRGVKSTLPSFAAASLFLSAALSFQIAEALEVVTPTMKDMFLDRGIGIATGLFLIVIGNNLPKQDETTCGGSAQVSVFRVRRFMGWSFMLAGLATLLIHGFAPLSIAPELTAGVVLLACLAGGTRCYLAFRESPRS